MSVTLPLPQVTRIPITGPQPYNTLVCVQTTTFGGPQNLTDGKLSRWPITVPTTFRLAGFDQRVVPVFEHSTTAIISSLGPEDDSNWVFAVDEVTGAGFSQVDGSYFVNLNMATSPGKQPSGVCFSFGDPQAGGYTVCLVGVTIQVLSYVLCWEPPLPPTDPRSKRHQFVPQDLVKEVALAKPSSHAELIARQMGRPFIGDRKRDGLSAAPDCRCEEK